METRRDNDLRNIESLLLLLLFSLQSRRHHQDCDVFRVQPAERRKNYDNPNHHLSFIENNLPTQTEAVLLIVINLIDLFQTKTSDFQLICEFP